MKKYDEIKRDQIVETKIPVNDLFIPRFADDEIVGDPVTGYYRVMIQYYGVHIDSDSLSEISNRIKKYEDAGINVDVDIRTSINFGIGLPIDPFNDEFED